MLEAGLNTNTLVDHAEIGRCLEFLVDSHYARRRYIASADLDLA